MKNLKGLSDDVLLETTRSLVAEERRVTTSVLCHLNEIERRLLYAQRGFSSLFEYAVKALGYSEPAAGRRIAAMRLLGEVPALEPCLKTGEMSLSTLSALQHFFQRQAKPSSPDEKKELALSLRGSSRRECEKALAALDPQAARPLERERVVSPTEVEIRFVADEALMEKLKRIRELDAHAISDSSYLGLFHRLADHALRKLDPSLKKERAPAPKATPPAEEKKVPQKRNPRFIPAALRREVWRRNQGCCAYVSPDGRKCSSRFALEIDHITPLALGGRTVFDNLRFLCRNHNRQQAVYKLGAETMRSYIRV